MEGAQTNPSSFSRFCHRRQKFLPLRNVNVKLNTRLIYTPKTQIPFQKLKNYEINYIEPFLNCIKILGTSWTMLLNNEY